MFVTYFDRHKQKNKMGCWMVRFMIKCGEMWYILGGVLWVFTVKLQFFCMCEIFHN